MRAAKSPEDRAKLFSEKNPTKEFGTKVRRAGREKSQDRHRPGCPGLGAWRTFRPRIDEFATKLLTIVARDYIESDKLGAICQLMGFGGTGKDKEFLRDVLEKNKNAEIRAEAALALAKGTAQKVMILKQMKGNPEIAKLLETEFGKDAADELKAGDPAKVEAESQQLLQVSPRNTSQT